MSDLLNLSSKERTVLESLVTTSKNVRQFQRARILLWLDEGERVEDIANLLHVSRQVIYKWVWRFRRDQDRPLAERLADAYRSGRPRTVHGVIDPLIDQVIDQDPSDFGYRSTIWTADLLVSYLFDGHRLAVSPRSVSYALERLAIGWKRPRYDLARRSPTWRQAKGG